VTFNKYTGLSIAKRIAKTHKNVKVVFFSQFDDPMNLMYSIRNGAKAFLNKNLPMHEFTNSIKLVAKGEIDFFYNKNKEFKY
jgi:DNA-binding NarL/FixJ family response regulator